MYDCLYLLSLYEFNISMNLRVISLAAYPLSLLSTKNIIYEKHNYCIICFSFCCFPKSESNRKFNSGSRPGVLGNTLIRIADPVIRNLSEDKLKVSIPVGRSSSAKASTREFVTHMESVGRTFAGLAPWLELGPDETPEGQLRAKYIEMSCKALANSVNPVSNDYFNSTATRQILVNSAFLIQGLMKAQVQL